MMTAADLQEALEEIGWSERMLAHLLNLPRSTIRGWTAGRSITPPDVAAWLQRLQRIVAERPLMHD